MRWRAGRAEGGVSESRQPKQPPRTIRELIDVSAAWLAARGIEGARVDCELLLAHALSEKRLALYLDMDRPLSDAERDAFRPLLARRGRFEPVAYILGTREFYSLPFKVTPDVLVPRPDTEVLVDRALERLGEDAEGLVLDIGTGSGCIAVAVAKERPGVRVIATDVSARALAIAEENARANDVADRVELREGDALAPVRQERGALALLSNPPYIREDEREGLMPDVRDHEPAVALFGPGADGLDVHRRILDGAAALVSPGGFVLLEAGFEQGPALAALEHPGLDAAQLYRDLAGRQRGAFWRVSEEG
jgi:release factor glutamine methyltransferase